MISSISVKSNQIVSVGLRTPNYSYVISSLTALNSLILCIFSKMSPLVLWVLLNVIVDPRHICLVQIHLLACIRFTMVFFFFFFVIRSLGGERQPRVQPAVSGPVRCGQTEGWGATRHQKNHQRHLEGAQPQKHSRNRWVRLSFISFWRMA